MSEQSERRERLKNAKASNPGELRVQPLRWFSHYPKWPLVWFLGALLFALATWKVHWAFAFPTALFLFANVFYWRKVRNHFRIGAANPGIVLQLDPMLIAVGTDLSLGEGDCPAVKVLEKRLSSIAGQPPAEGTELATVALYYEDSDPSSKRWEDFDPRPADCATSNQAELDRLMQSFDEEQYEFLRECIEVLPRPYTPGLHHLCRDEEGRLQRPGQMSAPPRTR